MVVNDFNVGRTDVGPSEADPKLIVDSNAVLPFSVRLQGLKSVAWRDPQVVQDMGLIQLVQSTPSPSPKV
jgi:hypothetical protein